MGGSRNRPGNSPNPTAPRTHEPWRPTAEAFNTCVSICYLFRNIFRKSSKCILINIVTYCCFGSFCRWSILSLTFVYTKFLRPLKEPSQPRPHMRTSLTSWWRTHLRSSSCGRRWRWDTPEGSADTCRSWSYGRPGICLDQKEVSMRGQVKSHVFSCW